MCIQCHQNLNNQEVLKQLQAQLKNSQFEQWNSTSLSHIQLTCAGANGHECRILAISILIKFLQWYEQKKLDCYFPSCGLERMPPKKEIQNVLNWMQSDEYKNLHLQTFIDTFPQVPQEIYTKWNSFKMERIPEKKNYNNSLIALFVTSFCLALTIYLS